MKDCRWRIKEKIFDYSDETTFSGMRISKWMNENRLFDLKAIVQLGQGKILVIAAGWEFIEKET